MHTDVTALKAQIANDKTELQQMEQRQTGLLSNIPRKGFQTATERVVLAEKLRVLRESIRKAEERLRAASESSQSIRCL